MLSDKEILKQAHERFNHCEVVWNDQKQKNTELLKFIAGDQWTYPARQNFENSGFSAITQNRLPTFLRQITNEIRKNTPQIQVDPRNDTDEKKAELINDLIRNIQMDSKADIAYTDAVENAAGIGIGYFRILTKFEDEMSFDQKLVIEPINDPNSVMLDPNHEGIAGEDMEYCFITTVLSKEEYKQKYSDSRMTRAIDGTETEEDFKEHQWTDSTRYWLEKDQVVINEYYFKDYAVKMLYQVMDMETGNVFTTMDLDNDAVKEGKISIVQKREVLIPTIRWVKLNDVEVLEQSEWPGKFIPVVPVKADEYWIDGKRKLIGNVEPALDAQMMLNYAESWRAQLLQMAPKAPYIGTAAQFKTYEQEWANINVSNQAFMVYNTDVTSSGQMVPPPSRDLGEVPMQGATALIQQAQQDLQMIFGVFDPSKQAANPESGKALLARQDQSYNSNFHVYDNLARSVQHAGCILVDAIPVVYDTSRTIQAVRIDGTKKSVQINQPNEYGVVEYDMTKGDYAVSIQTGPSYGTRRQETVEMAMNLMQALPQLAPAFVDIVVRNMDWPGAKEIADSLEAIAPPQVLAARKVDPEDAAAMVPALQSQIAQLQQQNQMLTAQHQQMIGKMNEGADNLAIEQLKARIEEEKSKREYYIKIKQLELQEHEALAEAMLKEEEIRLKKEALKLEAVEVSTDVATAMSEMSEQHYKHHVDHIDKISVVVPGTSINDIENQDDGGPKGDLND